MKTKLLILSIIAASPAFAQAPQNGTGETDGYKLVWQDLFDAGTLNRDRWNIEVNGDGGGNNELQYYTDRECNVSVGDDGQGNGCLILTAIREQYKGKEFTSGRVTSQKLVAFKHGKIEAAIRLPKTANGLWPAFWMMGNDHSEVGWPKSGETDILEMGHQDAFGRGTQDRYFNGAMHWGQGWPAASYALSTTLDYSLQDGEFHIFTAIWDDEAMSMYVDLDRFPDQKPYYKMTIPFEDPDNEWSPGNYFHKENFILFNVAVGGNFPGIHKADGITALNEENAQKASMYVNYVKIYQKGTDDESLSVKVPGDPATSGVESVWSGEDRGIIVKGGQAVCNGAELYVHDVAGNLLATARERVDLTGFGPGMVIISAIHTDGRRSVLKCAVK